MLALTAAAVCLLAASPVGVPELRIGLVPEQNIFRQVERHEPIKDWVLRKAGIRLRLVTLQSYEAAIERLGSRQLDGAFLGSYTAAVAIRQLGIRPLVRPVSLDGTSTYQGYLFVRSDSAIRSAGEMKGKVLVLVSPATTAGWLFPLSWLRSNRVTSLERHFRETYFAGSHDAAVLAVLERRADVGCAKSTIYDQLQSRNPRVGAELIVLARSRPVPSNVLAVRPDLDPKLERPLSQALLAMHDDPLGRRLLSDFGALRFISTAAEDYATVFEMAASAGVQVSGPGNVSR